MALASSQLFQASDDRLPALVRIPAGEFVMGADDAEEDERPAHPVHLDEFEIGVYPVTNEEYATFIAETGYRAPGIHDLPLVVTRGGREREVQFRQLAAGHAWPDGEPPAGRERHPVTLIRWEDASAYCRWLAHRTGRPFRLPTEAEWERAARGGLEGRRYPWGDEVDPARATYLADPSRKYVGGPSPVGSHAPNGFGVFDAAGNVWEWVADWYAPDYYARTPSANPRGPERGRFRILRGGAWLDADVRLLRCSHRHRVPPDTYSYSIGFRVACSERRREDGTVH